MGQAQMVRFSVFSPGKCSAYRFDMEKPVFSRGKFFSGGFQIFPGSPPPPIPGEFSARFQMIGGNHPPESLKIIPPAADSPGPPLDDRERDSPIPDRFRGFSRSSPDSVGVIIPVGVDLQPGAFRQDF